jgi:iron complex transport system permease protein
MKKTTRYFIILLVIFFVAFLINTSFGSVFIPFKTVIKSFFSNENIKESWLYIIKDYRLPKAITAILVGSGLSISGLLMQTLFKNPLAGPFVLGISSGSSLGVAFLILGANLLGFSPIGISNLEMAIASGIGAFIVLLAVILVSKNVRNTASILIIGLMFGSITTATISILAYFSSAEQLQQFMFWSFGSLGNLTWQELGLFFVLYLIGIILLIFVFKPLNSLLLGDNYAKSMGVNIKKTRLIIIVITAILTGVITAFSGPIAFVGLAVPHLSRMLFNTSNHKLLIPATFLIGGIVMLISDTIAQLPNSAYTLPINAITTIFGAPIVIWLLIRKKQII